ncbi:exosortase J [Granulicella rosea]|uniref:Exosortase J n=1 Tax=Granulicella rosea TaxID=474952 RepID=A0A239KS17_9BACT|nr:exosortase J [Granulicella rosea]SNT20855.1 exosortase J [Granulicella rosea]
MSTFSTAKALPPALTRTGALSPAFAAGAAALLTVLGVASIWPTAQALWGLWTTDALKSIGMVVPAVSFLLILRVWRSLRWEMDGTWWGLAILAITAVAVAIRNQSVLMLVLSPSWTIYFPPHSLVAFAYGAGAVLLFGGRRLFRASLFPIILLWFVNPIPHIFNVYVDLPLQRASAHIARGFAMALGQPLTADRMRLMFTPNFGMFIAPGCNGIRGAVTMGFIALIAGYLYRFRWRAHVLVVLGAVFLGYVFNFVRLCTLVLYYLLALHVPSLQDKAENADYLIGAALFLIACMMLFTAIQRLGAKASLDRGETEQTSVLALPLAPASDAPSRGVNLRLAAMAVFTIFSCFIVVRRMEAQRPNAALLADESALGAFPETAGGFHLVRRWNENLIGGALLFHWAEYAPVSGEGSHVSIGVSPVLGSHDTLICHSARGEDPLWQGETVFPTAGSDPVAFHTSFYNDGATQFLEATTLCNGSTCGEHSAAQMNFGFVYSRPDPKTLLSQEASRPIPILLKVETIDTTLPVDIARKQLNGDLQAFLSAVNLDNLTKPYRRN